MNTSISLPGYNELDIVERCCIESYAGNVYGPLNKYLLNTDTPQTYQRINQQELAEKLYYVITNIPYLNANCTISSDEQDRIVALIKSNRKNIEWIRRIMFRFAMLLYGSILKCKRLGQEIMVYRGVELHYLKDDKNHGRFLTSFTSTSINQQRALGFSNPNSRDAIIYHFIVKPGVACTYIGTDEAELLLNPYQLYYFVKKDDNHYFYIISPSNIIPPDNENNFSKFKKDIMVRTVAMEGGRTENKELHHTAIVSNYKNTRRSKNKKNKNTKKNKKMKRMNEDEHFRARMNLPIGSSSFSIPLTPEMIADRERVAREYHV